MKNRQFVIQPHFRLQEWVADEKGYFRDAGIAVTMTPFAAAKPASTWS